MKARILAIIFSVFLFAPGLALADGGASAAVNTVSDSMLGPVDRIMSVGEKYVTCVPAALEELVDNATKLPDVFKDAVDEDGWALGIFTGGLDVVVDLAMDVVEAAVQIPGCGFDEDCGA
jgi:hypothetical protein